MSSRIVTHLALAAPLALCAAAAPQSESSSKLVVGDGAISRGSSSALTQPNQQAFGAALAAIGGASSNAGTIEVMPGTYTFTSTVAIAKAGVRLQGGANAVIRLGAGFAGPLFRVQAPATDCVLDGVTLAFEGDASDLGGRVLLDVAGDGFTLTNCRIVVSTPGTPPGFQASSAMRISGAAGAGLFGILLEGNTFLAGRTDDPQGSPAPVDAVGWSFLRSSDTRNLRVVGNSFRSGRLGSDATPVRLGHAIHLVDDEFTSIVGNSFANLESSGPLPGPDSALIGSRESLPGAESNHMTFTGNRISACGGPSILSLKGHGFTTISGNAFDRVGSHADGTIYLLDNVGNAVTGNVFTNLGVVEGPSLRGVGGRSTCIQGNSFLVPDEPQAGQTTPQLVLEGEEGPLVCGNQFLAGGGATTLVEFDGCADGSIVGNRFETPSCQPLELSGEVGDKVFVCSNLFRLLTPDCPPPAWTAVETTVLQCDASSGNPGF